MPRAAPVTMATALARAVIGDAFRSRRLDPPGRITACIKPVTRATSRHRRPCSTITSTAALRAETVLEIADEVGHELPATHAEALDRWFVDAADSGTLERYLETFDAHRGRDAACRQDLCRVARECVEDLAADGVVYAEVRYAPEQHLTAGLTLDEVVEAVRRDSRTVRRLAASRGRPIVVRQILTAMRHAANSREIAELVVRHRDHGRERVRHRRRRDRLPADPTPRRVRVPPARERALHDPRG